MADVARIKVPDGTYYDLKDTNAIASISYSGHTATVTKRDGSIEQFSTADTTYTPSDATPAMNGSGAPGVSSDYSRGDHVHPSDTSKADIDSPVFTGTPTAPTATVGTNTRQIATTEFVNSAITAKKIVATDDGCGNVTIRLT